MHTVIADPVLNRLNIKITGRIEEAEAHALYLKILEQTKMLKPAFDVINDLRDYALGNPAASVVLTKSIEFFKSKKIGYVIRVVGGSKAALIQFAKFTQGAKEYNVFYVPRMEDVDKKLESLKGQWT